MSEEKIWYYADGGNSIGPFTEEEVQALHSSGAINDDTLLCKAGEEQWQSFFAIYGIPDASPAEEVAPLTSEPSDTNALADSASSFLNDAVNKTSAGIDSFAKSAAPHVKSAFDKANAAATLAGKQAQKKKLELHDLRQADFRIGKKAYEEGVAADFETEIRAHISEIRAKIETLRNAETKPSEKLLEKAKATAEAAGRMAMMEKLGHDERMLLTKLGTCLRKSPDQQLLLADELDSARAILGAIEKIDEESEPLRKRAGSWGAKPLILAAGVAVLLIFLLGAGYLITNRVSTTTSRPVSDTSETHTPSKSVSKSQLGPVVKGLYLGMDKEDALAVVQDRMGEDVFPEEATPEMTKLYAAKGREVILIRLKSRANATWSGKIEFLTSTGRIDAISFDPYLTTYLFKCENMQSEEFARNFVNSYGIPRMSVTSKLNSSFWIYNDPDGWTLAIRTDKNLELYATSKAAFGD